MPETLREKLLGSIEVVQDPSEFAPNDFRWAETKGNKVYVNHPKFKAAGAEGYEKKIVLAESLHRLRDVAPDIYDRLEHEALNDPEYMRWANESYIHSRKDYGEKRKFWKWHKESRFDQVIGGYIFASDKSLPTMKEWNRKTLPMGPKLKKLLHKLANKLGIE